MQSVWSDGYVTDVPYTPGYFREQMPSTLAYIGLMQSLRTPDQRDGFTWCELGCGQGLTAAIAAAAYPHGHFWAIDFNPAHIAGASDLAAAAELDNLIYHERSFSEAADSNDYPAFDFITLHGIYSWITPEIRNDILRFIRRFLKPGGMVYVSYNCLPGWARTAPIQHWLSQYAPHVTGNSITKAQGGLEFLERMREAGSLYFAVHPGVDKHIEGLANKPSAYLAHEYLNGAWHALYVTDVINEMEKAKLVYCGSAQFLDNLDHFSLNQLAQDQLKTLPTTALQELYRDFALNRNFRRDIYVRGAVPLGRAERHQRLNALRLGLIVAPEHVKYTAKCPVGEVGFDGPHCRELVAALAEGPRPIGEIRGRGILATLSDSGLLSAINTLLIGGVVIPVGENAPTDTAAAERLNRVLAERARDGEPLGVLVAPALAGGLHATPNETAMLDADWSQSSAAIADTLAERLRANRQSLIVNGRALENHAELVNHLQGEVDQFRTTRLPVFRLAGMIA